MNPLLLKPTLRSRFSTPVAHPRASLIEPRVLDYFQNSWPYSTPDLKARDATHELERWGILVCPNATDDKAELVSAYVKFWFMYDDFLESMEDTPAKVKASIDRVKGILSGGRLPEDPIESIIYELRQKILSCGDDVSHRLAEVLFHETCEYMSAAGDQEARAKSLKDGFEAYLQYRYMDGGFWFTIQLAYWGINLEIPSSLRQHPLFRQLELIVADHEMLVNDMFSYRWEIKQAEESEAAGSGFFIYSAVRALMQQENVGPHNVMAVLGQHIIDREARYEATLDLIRKEFSHSPADLAIIAESEKAHVNYMTGNLVFSQVARRYNFE